MVKMQIKMVKMALPILPETGKSPALPLPFNKIHNKIKEIKILDRAINMARGLYFGR
jgi:hypothetical protein